MKGKKKNLNKCKSVQSGLLQGIRYFQAVQSWLLHTPGLRAAVIEGDLQSDSRRHL